MPALYDSTGHIVRRSYYTGASHAPMFREFLDDSTGPHGALKAELSVLRSRSRQLSRNNAWQVGALESYVDNVIASGIDPEPKFPKIIQDRLTAGVTDKREKSRILADQATMIRECWDIWSGECDADGMADAYGQQSQFVRTVAESGECFLRRRVRRPEDGFYVPLQIQILEPDFVPHNWSTPQFRGNHVIGGIEFNPIGQRIGYHMYREHPGDISSTRQVRPDLVFVPASEVIHVAELKRPGQVRFEPKSTPTIKLLLQVNLSNEANLVLQTVGASFGGMIMDTRDDPEQNLMAGQNEYGPLGDGPVDERGVTEIEMVPGMLPILPPGYEPRFNAPPDIGSNYLAHQGFQLRSISRTWGLPYHEISGDMTSASFASLRSDQNKMERHILRILGGYRHQACDGIYAWLIREAVLSGRLDLIDYALMPRLWHLAEWNHTGWKSTNPLQDANAMAVELAWGITSRRRIVAERGANVRDVDVENAEDQERARELGVSYKGMEGQSTTRGEQIGPFSDDTEIPEDEPAEGEA